MLYSRSYSSQPLVTEDGRKSCVCSLYAFCYSCLLCVHKQSLKSFLMHAYMFVIHYVPMYHVKVGKEYILSTIQNFISSSSQCVYVQGLNFYLHFCISLVKTVVEISKHQWSDSFIQCNFNNEQYINISASRLNNVYYLTNKDTSTGEPSIDNTNGWNICYYNETALGDEYTVQCDRNFLTPFTRELSIRTIGGKSVELREVEIYGYGK